MPLEAFSTGGAFSSLVVCVCVPVSKSQFMDNHSGSLTRVW